METPFFSDLRLGTYIDCYTESRRSFPIRDLEIGAGLDEKLRLFFRNKGYVSIVLVADRNTFEVAGRGLQRLLGLPHEACFILDAPRADDSWVEAIRAQSRTADILLAVGSGTINDLCKYASFLDGKPYVVYGTALSMNGYASRNASIAFNGHKISVSAQLPEAIFLDTHLLARSPKRLTRSGIGDLLCLSSCAVDWCFSHLLTGSFFDRFACEILFPYKSFLYDQSFEALEGNQEAIHLLAECTLLSGFAMTLAGGSYPASQGEHMLVHMMEMLTPVDQITWLHGEAVGVTTLMMAHIQGKKLHDRLPPYLHYEGNAQSVLRSSLPCSVAQDCAREYGEKFTSAQGVQAINALLESSWPSIQRELLFYHEEHAKIHATLTALGSKCTFSELSWEEESFKAARRLAPLSRGRLTFLDCLD